MNRELLLKVADAIEANPEHFDMDDFYQTSCGTTACIAGWCAYLNQSQNSDVKDFIQNRSFGWRSEEISEAIGLPYWSQEMDALTLVEQWSNPDLQDDYLDAKTPLDKAKIAAAYVRWFVENN